MPGHEGRRTVLASDGPATPWNSRAIHSVAAAWVLSVAFDLFLHGGLLAGLYVEQIPFLLSPEEAFRRIPLGYLSFLVLTVGLFWLLRQLETRPESLP